VPIHLSKKLNLIIKATRNSKYLRKITEVIDVTKTEGGFKVVITSGTHLKMPRMFKKLALKEIKKSFPDMLNGITGEVAENL